MMMMTGQAANQPPPPKSAASASIHSTALPCYPPTCHGAASAPSQPRRCPCSLAAYCRCSKRAALFGCVQCSSLFPCPLCYRVCPFSRCPPYVPMFDPPLALRECPPFSWCSFRFRIPSSLLLSFPPCFFAFLIIWLVLTT